MSQYSLLPMCTSLNEYCQFVWTIHFIYHVTNLSTSYMYVFIICSYSSFSLHCYVTHIEYINVNCICKKYIILPSRKECSSFCNIDLVTCHWSIYLTHFLVVIIHWTHLSGDCSYFHRQYINFLIRFNKGILHNNMQCLGHISLCVTCDQY